jgi:molybdopterin/thiamine biosynthesis adenylyltransferase
MAKIIRLTESDLTRLVKRVIKEQQQKGPYDDCFIKQGIPAEKIPQSCKKWETYGPCVSEMFKSEYYKNSEWMDRVDKALDCMRTMFPKGN